MEYVEGDVNWWLSRISDEFREQIKRRLDYRGVRDLLGPNQEFEFRLELKVVDKHSSGTKDSDEGQRQE